MLLRYLTIQKLGAVFIENGLLLACALLDSTLYAATQPDLYDFAGILGTPFIFAIAFQVILHLRNAYDFRVRRS